MTAIARVGETYRVKCSNGESLVPKAVLAATQAGIDVRGVTVVKPTLDEVFLQLTGHEYREEGLAAAPGDAPAGAAPPAGGR